MSRGHVHPLHVHGHSPVHRLTPEAKVLALLLFVPAVVATPRNAIWAFAVHAFFLAAVIVHSEVPVRFVAGRMAIEVPFVLFALFLPFAGPPPDVEVAGLALSREGLWAAWNIVAKATLGVGASVVLVATTEVPDVLRGLDRLRMPRLVTAIAGFMIRYLEVVASEVGRTRVAMAARGHDPRWIWQSGPLASSAGALFVRSYERGERVYDAMLARGYDGSMPALDARSAGAADWAAGLLFPLLSWAVAALALLGGT